MFLAKEEWWKMNKEEDNTTKGQWYIKGKRDGKKEGYNQALKDAKKKCNECKEDFILIAKDWEKDYKKLNENTNIQLKQYRRMLNEYGKKIREFKEEKIEGLKKK